MAHQSESAARAVAASSAECRPQPCEVVRPTDPLITDFTGLGPGAVFVDGDDYDRAPADWWRRFYGSPYVYPTGRQGLTQASAGQWDVEGQVDTWSGFGLWLGACDVDLSSYIGVSFEIWGEAGPSHSLVFAVASSENAPPEKCRSNLGTCDPRTNTCAPAKRRIDVPRERGAPRTVLWRDLNSGSPHPSLDPSSVLQLQWVFDWSGAYGPAQAYRVSIHVDNIRLLPRK